MKSFTKLKCAILFGSVLIILYWYSKDNTSHKNLPNLEIKPLVANTTKKHIQKENVPKRDRIIYLAVVACGDRVSETLNMLKSALMFTKSMLYFLIVAEDGLHDSFQEKLKEWQTITKNLFEFKLFNLDFPKDMEAEWKKLFKPCASQRLFLPTVLPDIDSVIYVDTDTVFLAPIDEVWEHFSKMNDSQLAALAPEQEDANVGWYNRFAKHPYYGQFGVNSGVMLMNLTRMRKFSWTKYVIPIYQKYKLNIIWGDQDIINIIFHYYPDKLYIYSCRFNYRPDHCMYMSVCKDAEKNGVVVLHGSRGFFHSARQPVFQAIYRTFQEYEMGTDKYNNFLLPLEAYLASEGNTSCGHVSNMFLINVRKYVASDYDTD